MTTKSKIFISAGALISSLLLISQILFFYRLWDSAMLPLKLFSILLFIASLISLLLIITMLLKSGKKYILKTFAFLFSIIITVCYFFGSFVTQQFHNTLDKITQSTNNNSIGVYVLTNDPAQDINDVSNYKFGVTYSVDKDITKEALKLIEADISKQPFTIDYDSIPYVINSLYSQNVKAILLSQTQFNHLCDIDEFSDIPKRIRLIKSYALEETKESKPNISNSDIVNKPFIIYISGSDTRSEMLDRSRSDVNILAAVNPKTKKILLLNTPRDYFIPNPALNNELDKLTHCGLYGTQCSIDALSSLYGKPILGYVQINFTGFEKLIDTIGGIDVYSDFEFTTYHGDHPIKKGLNHLNGSQALCFVRERYALPGGDNDRGKNQMKVIKAIIDKLSASTVIKNYSDLLKSAEGMFSTNISNDNISALVRMQLSDMAKWKVETYAVTGRGGMDTPASMYGTKAYVMYQNSESVETAKNKLDKIFE